MMYSFVYLLRYVDLYFNKHVIMMNLKISGFLMPVQILKYAVICNIFMQARMKYRASRNRLARHFEHFCLFIYFEGCTMQVP